ncbi:MAG TPA: malto-oligosyltrehalose synthase [Vicinamibacterales bacterium]|nr:malto-oligosyltrehalose synthase [Vicinamibacterales bacterium]
MDQPRFVPTSSYRLQVHGSFPFTAARDVVPYLARLGIGAVYTSPYFAAEPGSTHGYDITNHNELSAEAGGTAAHTAFTDAVRAAGLQHIVDFVPNHMGISTATNPWWRDVLANGADAPSAHFFDIDWNPFKTELRAKLLLPVLGDQYGQVLERGELQLRYENDQLLLAYSDHRLPVNARPAAELERLHELAPAERDEVLARYNGIAGRPRSFDALHDLLEEQAYRLAYWRTASHEINYRRFFDVNTLAGLRVEDPDVFTSIHQLLARLIREGRVTGVRIDHPDGLFDPARYFEMLQDLAAEAWGIERTPGSRPLYVVAEKILSGRERLPARWAAHGTTGYNFLNQVNGLFVEPANAKRMRRVYGKVTGRTQSFDDLIYETKRLIMDTSMASELTVLAHTLDRIGESNRRSRDFTLNSLRDMLVEVVACFPIYRTYVSDQGWDGDDRTALERAIVRARRRNPAMDSTIFDFFREVMLPRDPADVPVAGPDRRGGYPPADEHEAAERLRFAMKFQQYTGPLQAKGLEDTVFYRHNVLVSLNEVGGDPSRFGVSAPEFHELNQRRRHDWPFEMIGTSTHDTKLGEDVRARIDVLSEIPDDWEREVTKWMRLNKAARTIVDGEPVPDRNDEYRIYQVLTGAWPIDVPRLQTYMTKAVKEGKEHSSWINPNEAYEAAVAAFVERVLSGPEAAKFLPAFQPFQERVARSGVINSLAQVLLKIASPGVPDFYQGSELWDLNLVDPDNRRPVDFDRRRVLLDRVDALLAQPASTRAAGLAALLAQWQDGAVKLLVTAAGLRLRAAAPALFLEGDYLPLEVETTVEARVLAFARLSADGRAAIAVAPHLSSRLVTAEHPVPLGDRWRTSRIHLPDALAGSTYRDAFSGATLKPTVIAGGASIFVGEALRCLPVALLVAV